MRVLRWYILHGFLVADSDAQLFIGLGNGFVNSGDPGTLRVDGR